MGTNIRSITIDVDLENELIEFCDENSIKKSTFISDAIKEKLKKEKK